jgi:DUF1680 family protein
VPGHVTVQTGAGEVVIESKTNYPTDGSVALTLRPAKAAKFPLYLRVPAWTAHYTATVAGHKYTGTPGEFLTIDREWKAGDQVDVDLDLTVRVVSGAPSYPFGVAIFRGPQVLALEQSRNPGVRDLQAAGPTGMDVKLEAAGDSAYRMDGVVAGKPRELTLVPFADARSYRVWLLKP